MDLRKKSQRGFVAVTLLTVLSIATVLVIYAALLGTFPGGEVTVGGVGPAQVRYSFNNANDTGPWTPTLEPGNATTPWYARFEITNGDYSGPVNMTWQLQKKNGTDTWSDIAGGAVTTLIVLSGTPTEYIYATGNGTWVAGNHDWGSDVTEAGTYRVYVTVNSD